MTKIIAISVLSAAIPVAFWFFIIHRKKREKMTFRFWLTFFISGIGAILIFKNQTIVENFFVDRGFSIFLIFAILGTGIEYFKNITVRICGFKYFRDIDDVVDLSFASALGFTFFENIFFFMVAFSGQDPEVIGPVKMIKYFLTREFFILPIHLFCSGIFGYFYGMAIFSGNKLKNKNQENIVFLFLQLIPRIFLIPKKYVFKFTKIMEGTIVSVFFYALFFTLMKIDPMISDIFKIIQFDFFFDQNGNPYVDEHLLPLISFVFFKIGTVILFNLMDRKKRFSDQNYLKSV